MRARRTFWRWTLAVTLPLLVKAGLGCVDVAGIYLPANESCRNGVKDTTERGVDCGGPCIGACTGETCENDNECASGKCDKICLAPRCNDGIWNGTEIALDVCPFNPPNALTPCEDAFCYPAQCYDNVKNGPESDVDCGGKGGCHPCGDGKVCTFSLDCTSENCVNNVCACAHCASFITTPVPRFLTPLCNTDLVAQLIDCACRGPCSDACGMECERRGFSACESCIQERCTDAVEACSMDR